MNLKPLGDRLIVEVLEEEETTVSRQASPSQKYKGGMDKLWLTRS